MDSVLIFFIVIIIIGAFNGIIRIMNENAAQQRQKEIEDIKKEQTQKQENLLQNILNGRTAKYGLLTKRIKWCSYHPKSDIFVYEETRTIFINNREYKFSDILSCRYETSTIKGKETITTVPDANEKATAQFLWGANWKQHISKTNTIINREPDKILYTVYIGTRNLSTPQIKIELGENPQIANEIVSTIDIIIYSNQGQC